MSVYGTDILQLHRQLFLPADSTEVGSPEGSPPHQLSAWLPTPTALDGHGHKTAPASFRCPWWFRHCKTGPECQPAVHRLRLWGLALGSASPCADCHGAGTLGFTVSVVFTQICAYSFRHPHFPPLQANVSTGPSLLRERSPTPVSCDTRPSFGGPLNPDHSRRISTRRVSYYALFKGMAASKPTSSLSQ